MRMLDLLQLRRQPDSRAALRAASPEVIDDSVRALLTQAEASDIFDYDQFLSLGVFLRGTGHVHASIAAIAWMEEKPTALRVDAACALICGLWLHDEEAPPVSRAELERLIAARPAERLSPDAEYSFALAVMRPLEDARASQDVVSIATHELREAMARGTGDASLDESLASSAILSIPR
jgi:hypothetical protein